MVKSKPSHQRKEIQSLSFLALLFALTSLPLQDAQARQPNGCPDYSPPTVVVEKVLVPPFLDHSLDLAQLKAMAMTTQKEWLSTRHQTPVGLTAASLQLKTLYEIAVTRFPDDPLVCAQISTFTLRFGFEDTTVYMAQELPNPSCAYAVVLGHENKHVNVDRAFVEALAPSLEEVLRQALAQIGTLRASSGEVAQKQIHKKVKDYVAGLGQNLSQTRQKYQAKVDTPEEYDRLSASCGGELSRLIAEPR